MPLNLSSYSEALGFSGDCSNRDCSFLHVKPAFKTQNCPWYEQGFCKDGEALTKGALGDVGDQYGGLPAGEAACC